MFKVTLSLVCCLTLVASHVLGANFTTGTLAAKKFGTHEIVLIGNRSVLNPFNTIATVTFTSPSGLSVTVRAFYDGGCIWRARVYVNEVGTWKWLSSCPADPELDRKSGTFIAEKSNLRGMLKKDPSNPRAWTTDDGRWFLAISDTAWYLLNGQESLWRQYILDVISRGVNVLGPVGALGSPFTGSDKYGAGHKNGNNPWTGGDSPEYKDYKRYDLAKFQEAESRVIWIFNNFPEVYIRSLLFGTEMQIQWEKLLPSAQRNTLDYMIARWSALPNLYWLISDDQDVTRLETLAFNRDVGNYFATHEPWKHLMSTQPARFKGFPFVTPSDLKWVDFINIQDGNGSGAEQVWKYKLGDIPLHVTLGEDFYEQDYGGPPSGFSDPRYYVRWSFWSWILSGASYTYGGRWGIIHPYSTTMREDAAWIAPWTKLDFTGYPLKGLDSVPYILSYFVDRKIDLRFFIPNNRLVSYFSHPSNSTWHPNLMQCGSNEFLVYHPNAATGGYSAKVDRNQKAMMSIDLSEAVGNYEVEWYRPDDGSAQKGLTIQGGALRDFVAPWRGYDVVLRLVRNTGRGSNYK